MQTASDAASKVSGFAPVNGLRMYYESVGEGDPLIFISCALSACGLADLQELPKRWRVIQMDLQGHGRTRDIDRPLSIEQHARDVSTLLEHLKIEKAHILGWSYGGLIAMHLALMRPDLVNKVATYGSILGSPGDAIRLEVMGPPQQPSPQGEAHRFQRDYYEKVAPDPGHWPEIWRKVIELAPTGLTADQLASIKHRVLVSLGDNDFIRLEHAIAAYRSLPNAELAVVPDATHFLLFEAPWRFERIAARFFSEPTQQTPKATIASGYQPGKWR